jgi:hypothetical protein
MALQLSPDTGTVDATREQILELVGRRAQTLPASAAPEDTPAMLTLQLQLIDNFVELIRMRTEIADRDARIVSLSAGIRTWRERVGIEQAARRRDAGEAREREREVVSLLHQQMQVADTAMTELERIRSLPWWRRLRS